MSTLKRSIRNYMQVAMVLAFFCLVFLKQYFIIFIQT